VKEKKRIEGKRGEENDISMKRPWHHAKKHGRPGSETKSSTTGGDRGKKGLTQGEEKEGLMRKDF